MYSDYDNFKSRIFALTDLLDILHLTLTTTNNHYHAFWRTFSYNECSMCTTTIYHRGQVKQLPLKHAKRQDTPAPCEIRQATLLI